MLTRKEIYKYKNIILNENSIESDLLYVERKLKYALQQDKNNSAILDLLGKLYIVKNNISLAKQYLERAIELKENSPTTYYSLFKVNVILKQYDKAKENLEKFILYNCDKTLNLDLYKLLIDKLLKEETEYNINDVYFYEKLNGNNLSLYLNGIKAILDEDYNKSKKHFNDLDNIVKKQHIRIDFSYVIKLVEELNKRKQDKIDLIKRKNIEEQFQILNTEIRLNIDYDDEETISNNIDKLLNLDLSENQIKETLQIIPKLLNNDYYTLAININENIKNRDHYSEYSRMTSFYERLINELNEIYLLEGDKKYFFQTTLNKGRECLKQQEYDRAMDYFDLGMEKTNIKLFHYYIGKTLYKLRKFKESRRELLEYSKYGAYKSYVCKLYLSLINFRFGKKGKAFQMDEDARFYAYLLGETYEMNLKQLKSFDDKYLTELFETIDITEEDFINGNQLIKK